MAVHIPGGSKILPLFQITLGGAILVSFLPQYHHPWNLDIHGAAALVFVSISQAIAYLAWDTGIRLGNIVVISLLADFIPWLSLATAAVVLGAPIELRTVLSAMLLAVGAMLTRYGTTQRASRAATAGE